MASKSRGKFTFPLDPETEKILQNDKVCVVGVIGKSAHDVNNFKASAIDTVLRRNIFQGHLGNILNESDAPATDTQLCKIEGYYDAETRTIYLHMIGVFDTPCLSAACRTFQSQLETKGFLHTWADMKHSQAKGLLFIFSVSHIILIVHPVPTFDVSYIQLFKTIDGIRQKAQPYLMDVLKDCSVSNDWMQAGRPCSPRALFLFHSPNPGLFGDRNTTTSGSRSSKKISPIKKLEHALEDQIYRILRKSRVITNISMNSLFAIPANQEFVFVHVPEPEAEVSDPVSFLMKQLHRQCMTSFEDSGFGGGRRKDETNGSKDDGGFAASTLSLGLGAREPDHDLRHFLSQHIQLARTKGFDDNVGRHSGAPVFELPSGKSWSKVSTGVYHMLFAEDPSSAVSKDVLSTLRSQVDVDGRFSEARCLKVLPVATAAYQEGLPTHYSSEVHLAQLAKAFRIFSLHARGPAFDSYSVQLREECEKFWKNGHQLCEVQSLTENPCLKPIHRLPSDSPEESDLANNRSTHVPVSPHCSQFKLTSVCNCGRKQAIRDDPFDSKAANFDFYEQQAKICCFELERLEFPVFQPSTADYRAAKIALNRTHSHTGIAKRDSAIILAVREDRELSVVPGMSLALSLGQSLGTSGEASGRLSLQPDHSPQDTNRSGGVILVSDSDSNCSSNGKNSDKALIRQVSTTEYLPGMLHSDSPTGLLPSFQSWSLVCLGPSSLYSHNIGIQDQPGFITNTNFLLPWDVTVKAESKDKWPTLAETSGKKSHPLKGKKGGRDSCEFTVKIFLGVEYECHRGHRFMCSAPDKILKASGSGLVKENANKITTCDMPLYFPCPCRSAKPVIAQLMRVHVVTPKAPVHVTLDPKVQPAPGSCPIFYPGNDDPVRLTQSTYWVLRLPFIYEGDQGPYLPVKEKKMPSFGRLLKGMYGVLQISQEK